MQESALQRWHGLTEAEAREALLALCGSARWAETLAARRPYDDAAHLEHAATNLWFLLNEVDWLEAFGCHPRIGERVQGAGDFLERSAEEQAAVRETMGPDVAEALRAGNAAYEARFGFLYIVFASGRRAEELLAVLESRMSRDRVTELHEAARQQHGITRMRMRRWLEA